MLTNLVQSLINILNLVKHHSARFYMLKNLEQSLIKFYRKLFKYVNSQVGDQSSSCKDPINRTFQQFLQWLLKTIIYCPSFNFHFNRWKPPTIKVKGAIYSPPSRKILFCLVYFAMGIRDKVFPSLSRVKRLCQIFDTVFYNKTSVLIFRYGSSVVKPITNIKY